MSTTLDLVLTQHWFDETAAGRKDIEYRALTPHWMRRIIERRDELTHVRFRRGYTTRTLPLRTITLIDIGPCPIPGWAGNYIRIHSTPTP